ncbi:MAG: restriction endonuclease subunit S [Bacteroidia bacterium]|nr:restriction endonuclease subunit S [Bacteroidia bacterium]
MNKQHKRVPELRFPEFEQDGEWEEKKLGEITSVVSKRNKKKKDFPIYSINNREGFIPQGQQFEGVDSKIRGYDTSLYKVINKNTFAYNPARIDVGSLGYSGELNNILISSLYVCFITDNELDDYFLLYFFNTFQFNKRVKDNLEGGIRNYLFYENFSRINVAYPNLLEQQKIASCLSTLDDLLAAQRNRLQALHDHKKGLMQKLFPQKGERVPQFRFPEFARDGEWVEKKLGEVCEMQAGKFISASDIFQEFSSNLFPCYGGNGLRGFVKSHNHEGLFSLIGRQGALCGNITLAEGKFYATEHALVVKPSSFIETKWLYWALIYLNLNKYSTGQAQPGLSVNLLEKVDIFCPSTIQEQQKIASCLSALDDSISALEEKIKQLELHKKGLLQGLFPSATN